MASPIRIWTSTAYHSAFLCGGWASVRDCGGQVTGAAGGERNTAAGRMALAGLASALRDLPPGDDPTPINVHTTSPELLSFAGFLADPSGPLADADEDLDLWAQILAASKGRRLRVVHAPLQPDTPAAFAAAWAELAKEKAKASGAFTAPIPKLNLAKAPGLG
jgi:hypothetical protein